MQRILICIILSCLIFNIKIGVSAYPVVQPDFIITDEDIANAVPTEADTTLTRKMAHDVEIMEKRHFANVNNYDSDRYRIAKLETFLLGRTWEFSPIQERMDRLKLASQRKALSGMSLPVGIRRYVSPSRIANDSTPIYEDENNVGIIDGLIKLYAPEVYKKWSIRKKHLRECYSDG